MVNLSKPEFVKSAPTSDDFLPDKGQVVFLGRSNVGKSSLINALTSSPKLVYVSKTPGRTQMINYFLIDHDYYLVDAPGYGFYERGPENFEKLMSDYLGQGSDIVKMAYVLIDSRRGIADDDLSVIKLLEYNRLSFTFVLTKADKLNQSEKAAALKTLKASYPEQEAILVSVKDKSGIDEVRKHISKSLQK